MVRVRELINEINETADEIRAQAAILRDETPPGGISHDGE